MSRSEQSLEPLYRGQAPEDPETLATVTVGLGSLADFIDAVAGQLAIVGRAPVIYLLREVYGIKIIHQFPIDVFICVMIFEPAFLLYPL